MVLLGEDAAGTDKRETKKKARDRDRFVAMSQRYDETLSTSQLGFMYDRVLLDRTFPKQHAPCLLSQWIKCPVTNARGDGFVQLCPCLGRALPSPKTVLFDLIPPAPSVT